MNRLKPETEKKILDTITQATPDGIDLGKITIEFDLKDGGIRNIRVKPEYMLPNTH